MNERIILRFSLVASGVALAVSLVGLAKTKQNLTHLNDHILEVKADNAKIRADLEKKADVGMVIDAVVGICKDLGGGDKCGESQASSALPEPFPASLVAGVRIAEKTAEEIRVGLASGVASTIFASPEHLAAEIDAIPAVKDGTPAGFEIRGVREGGLFAAMGFQKGDVVHAILGKPVVDTASLASVWGERRVAKSWTFELSRAGSPLKIVVTDAKR